MDIHIFMCYSLWLTLYALFYLTTTTQSIPPGTENINATKYPSYAPPLFPICPIDASKIPRPQIIPYDRDSPRCLPPPPRSNIPVFPYDKPPMHFALNIEYTEAEWFLHGAYGFGLDRIAPDLAHGGPPPIDGRKANLDDVTQKIVMEFALQEVGHIRYIEAIFGPIQRPLIDLSTAHWARLMDMAFGHKLEPPFDPYRDSLHYMIASYVLPYLGVNGYTGTNPNLDGYYSKEALAGLLGVESAQDAIIRGWLFERLFVVVEPYGYTVAEFTDKISNLRNRLAMCGIRDEGLTVLPELGAEMKICTNVIAANADSVSYPRAPKELLRIMYETGDEHVPGGFLPHGGNGEIARMYLDQYKPNFTYTHPEEPGYAYEEYPYLDPPTYYRNYP